MLKITLTTLIKHYGEAVRGTDKVLAWRITDTFEVVAERNVPEKGHYANVWLPHFSYAKTLPNNVLLYPKGKGRHSNTYASRGLEKGKPALKIKIKNSMELAELISYIDALKHLRA